MSERAPYSRVYWAINRDEKFAGVFSDDAALALWLRLLMTADALWPASAPLPRSAKKRPLSALVKAGLVDLESDDFYRIHGLDDERGRRAAAARRDPVATQLGPKREAGGNTDETRRDETSTRQDETTREVPDGRADLEAFLLVTRRAPTPKQRDLLDRLLDVHDVSGPQWAADIILRNPTDPIGAVIKADKVWRDARVEEAKAAEKPKPPARRSPGLSSTTREILAEMQRREAEKGAA